jgi:hypothetical protein
VVRRNDSPSDDSPTSYVRDFHSAGDIPTSAVDRGELSTSYLSVDAQQTSIVRQDDIPTSVMPAVAPAAKPARRRSSAAIVATWAGFAVVAIAVVWATTAWAASLRGPGDGSQASAPSLANLPTLSDAAPPPSAPAPEEPAPETEPGQATQPQATRAPVRTARPNPTPVQPPGPQVPPPPPPPPVTTAPPTTTQQVTPRDDPPTCFSGRTNVPPGCTPAPTTPRPTPTPTPTPAAGQ